MGIWETLGIERTREARDIRRAYARRLKDTHPEDDPAGFQALREAYEQALTYAERGFEFAGGVFFNDGSHDEDDEAEETPEASLTAEIVPPPTAAGPEAPRPDPAAEAFAKETAELDAAFRRLTELVDAFPPASDAALALGLEVLFASPAMQNLDLRARVERRLARLIVDAAPRADGLIPATIRALGWKPHGRGPLAATIDEVFERQAALGYLRELKLKRHPHHEGYRLLQGQPPTSVVSLVFRPGALTALRRIVERLDNEHPVLAGDFPNLEAWQAWLAKPRLSPLALWVAALPAPMIGAVVGAATIDMGPGGLLAGAAAGGLGMLALVFAHLYLVLWPRQQWRRGWAWRTPAWVANGWIPGTVVLLLASALAPASTVSFWTQLGAGSLLVLWTAIVGDIDRREAGQPWQLRLGMLHGYYLVWLILMAIKAPQATAAMAPALLAAGAVALLGSGTLADLWIYRPGPGGRLAGAGALLATAALAAVLAAGLPEAPERLPLVMALAAIAVAAARPISEGLGEGAIRIRHWVGWAGLIGVLNLAARGTPYDALVLCAWILSGPLIAGIGALFAASQERR